MPNEQLEAAVAKLESDATAIETAGESIVAVLVGVKALYDEAVAGGGGNLEQVVARVAAVSAKIEARAAALTNAALANTPGGQVEPPVEEPPPGEPPL